MMKNHQTGRADAIRDRTALAIVNASAARAARPVAARRLKEGGTPMIWDQGGTARNVLSSAGRSQARLTGRAPVIVEGRHHGNLDDAKTRTEGE